MRRRLLACAVAVVTLAAPVLVTLCQVMCATEAVAAANGAGGGAPSHHSCHEGSHSATAVLSGVPHACGHTTTSPDGEQGMQSLSLSIPLGVVPSEAWSYLPPVLREIDGKTPFQHSPPGSFARISQLRV
jgi:hypothetical protein